MDRRHNTVSHYNPPINQENIFMDEYDNYTAEYQEHPEFWQPSFAHPQSEDDYFDSVDVMSSPTPLPRRSLGANRHATRRARGASMSYPEFENSATLEYGTDHQSLSYPYQGTGSYTTENPNSLQETRGYRPESKQNRIHSQNASCALSEKLIPVSTLPDWCRTVFRFGVFNAMQSRCFDTAVNTNSNMVISAPTGAGKTVIFELAVIRLLQSGGNGFINANKCVYVAPTKAICSERSKDWSHKFAHIGVKCCELTGDTMKSGRSAWKEAKDCAIIITTPEKWDSLTRNWNDSSDFLQQIKLFMVDEVHTVSETTRGSCLEVVVSRMMQRGNNVRFVLVSATAPNIEDLKDWLSSCSSGETTNMFKFGDEYRPCKLQRHVYGFPRPQGHNDFQFMKTLDYKLFPIIQEHSTGKPVLVFCPTRKSVMSTAEHLMEVCQTMIDSNESLPWGILKGLDNKFSEPQLQALANFGLGVHHAGLSLDERHTVEELFTQRKLSVIIATSTLAVGVNFPAHVVIVKGVTQWSGSGWTEYSSQDIMQMLGRAGRPQFDREGIAVIMCDKSLESKYKLLATGGSQLESTLHHNITEHINSEIGLGTIKSVDTAKQWLRKTFLFRRLKKNPKHYNMNIDLDDGASWEECVDAFVTSPLKALRETRLVTDGENDELLLTQFGEIMSYYIRQSTMKLFIDFANENNGVCLRSVLAALSGAEEFKDMHMRGGERQVYNKLSEHESIRFPVKKAETSADKAFLLIQAILGGVPLMSTEFKSPNSQPHMEALNVMRHAPRMIAALVDTALATKNGGVITSGMSLMRSLNGKAWEDRPAVLKQLEGIGEKSYKVLAENGITTIKSLATQDPGRIEQLLNRRPPFGSDVVSNAQALPAYSITVEEVSSRTNNNAGTVDVTLSISISARRTSIKETRFTKVSDTRITSILTISSDNQFIDFRRISTQRLLESANFSVIASLTRPSQTVLVIVSSDKFAGITERYDFKPSLPPNTYPTLDTRPPKAYERVDTTQEEDILDLTNSDSPGERPNIKPNLKAARDKLANAPKDRSFSKPGVQPTKTRLPNGNYACHHKCKDKTACRHICCREGLPKPPPSPKGTKAKTDRSHPTDSTLSSPSEPARRSKNQSEKQKSQLDYLHSKTAGDGLGQIKRARDLQPSAKTTTKYVESLFSSSPIKASTSKPKLQARSLSSDDQDLPEPSAIRVSRRAASPGSSGSNSYDDSEMDRWAADLPSEVLEVDVDSSEQPARPKQAPIDREMKLTAPPLAKRKKRSPLEDKEDELAGPKLKRTRHLLASSDELPTGLDTPARKAPIVEVLPTPRSSSPQLAEQKPLFRPSSSAGLASPGSFEPSAASEGGPEPPTYEDDFEKFMDYMFEGVKIVTQGASNKTTTKKPQTTSISGPITRPQSKAQPVPKETPKIVHPTDEVPAEQEAQKTQEADPMAEFNMWLDANGL